MERITKIEAGIRQLNSAIELLFAEADPIVVHTLAVGACNIFSDIADNNPESTSWRRKMRLDHGMTEAEIKNVINKSWNFFKHANRDANGVLEFDKRETEHLIFFATIECGEICSTSLPMQVFQLWFLASGAFRFDEDNDIQRTSESIFPELHRLSRQEQLHAGKEMLALQIEALRKEI